MFGFRYNTRRISKVLIAFLKLAHSKNTEEMEINDFKKILIQFIEKYDDLTDSQTLRFIEGYARNYIPELLPYAEKLYLEIRV